MPPALLEAPCSSQVHDVDERFSLLVYGSFGTSGANSRAVNFVSRRVVIRKCSIPGVVCLCFHEWDRTERKRSDINSVVGSGVGVGF